MRNVDDKELFQKVMKGTLEKSKYWKIYNHETKLYFNEDFSLFCQRVHMPGGKLASNVGFNPNSLTYCETNDDFQQWIRANFKVNS